MDGQDRDFVTRHPVRHTSAESAHACVYAKGFDTFRKPKAKTSTVGKRCQYTIYLLGVGAQGGVYSPKPDARNISVDYIHYAISICTLIMRYPR